MSTLGCSGVALTKDTLERNLVRRLDNQTQYLHSQLHCQCGYCVFRSFLVLVFSSTHGVRECSKSEKKIGVPLQPYTHATSLKKLSERAIGELTNDRTRAQEATTLDDTYSTVLAELSLWSEVSCALLLLPL